MARASLIVVSCFIFLSSNFISNSLSLKPQTFLDKLWPFTSSQTQTQYTNYIDKPPRQHYNNNNNLKQRTLATNYYHHYPLDLISSNNQQNVNNNNNNNNQDLDGYELSERYDYDDDGNNYNNFYNDNTGAYERQAESKSMEHLQAEGREISLVYPILLAILIIGALFIPFVSLFFFLTVSAFNCNGIGSFAQVSPFLGKRRRRRSLNEVKRIVLNLTTTTTTSANNKTTNGTREPDSITKQITTTTTTASPRSKRPDLMLGLGQVSMLEDADDHGASSSNFEHHQNGIFQPLNYMDYYGFWRKQLARNTIKLLNALLEFGGFDGDNLSGLQDPKDLFGSL